MKLILCVRKFFCRVPYCERRIFTERLPKIVAPWARTTQRLTMLLRAVAFALGGEAGARLAKRIGLATSPATLSDAHLHDPADTASGSSSRPYPWRGRLG